jgi:hypothetical protein
MERKYIEEKVFDKSDFTKDVLIKLTLKVAALSTATFPIRT